jgi:predicted  nucleic acid-binding Zn-ribbon protein
MEMGGAKSAKHLGSENDRATLVIEELQKKIGAAKEKVSQAETNYLSFEETLSVTKSRTDLRQKDIVARVTSLDGKKKHLLEQRAPKAAELSPEIASTYDKLRLKHPDPATTIDDGSCATCYTNIPMRISNAVKSGSPEICPGCHRYLVATLAIGVATESEELI